MWKREREGEAGREWEKSSEWVERKERRERKWRYRTWTVHVVRCKIIRPQAAGHRALIVLFTMLSSISATFGEPSKVHPPDSNT